jgi:hypothetical protein
MFLFMFMQFSVLKLQEHDHMILKKDMNLDMDIDLGTDKGTGTDERKEF